jgi:protein-disulfide isomerase
LAVYGDYQCPFCQTINEGFADALTEIAAANEVRVEYRTLTFLDPVSPNESSTLAALAATCADTVGDYRTAHDLIFEQQPAVEGDGFDEEWLINGLPTAAGWDAETTATYQQCFQTRSTLDFVRAVNAAGGAAGVGSVPTLYLNGEVLNVNAERPTSGSSLTEAVNAALGHLS